MIVTIAIGPKAANVAFVGDIAGLGGDGAGKGGRWNLDELRVAGRFNVKFDNEAMLVAVIVGPKFCRLAMIIYAEQILGRCGDVRRRAGGVIHRRLRAIRVQEAMSKTGGIVGVKPTISGNVRLLMPIACVCEA